MHYEFLHCHHYSSYSEYNDSFSLSTWITIGVALLALFVSIRALIVSIRGNKFQTITFINGQLIEVAKRCNSYLVGDYQVYKKDTNNKDIPITGGRASSIVTALEDAQTI